jgi:hypothetical protein
MYTMNRNGHITARLTILYLWIPFIILDSNYHFIPRYSFPVQCHDASTLNIQCWIHEKEKISESRLFIFDAAQF